MKLKTGDIYRIKTKTGYGFLQYIDTDGMGIESIRVLEPISESGEILQSQVDIIERWVTGFPLKVACRRKIVEKVGNFEIPKTFINHKYSRSEHNIRGEFKGWFIIEKANWKRELKQKLAINELKYSPHGIMNDTLIIERLETNWRLEDWK